MGVSNCKLAIVPSFTGEHDELRTFEGAKVRLEDSPPALREHPIYRGNPCNIFFKHTW